VRELKIASFDFSYNSAELLYDFLWDDEAPRGELFRTLFSSESQVVIEEEGSSSNNLSPGIFHGLLYHFPQMKSMKCNLNFYNQQVLNFLLNISLQTPVKIILTDVSFDGEMLTEFLSNRGFNDKLSAIRVFSHHADIPLENAIALIGERHVLSFPNLDELTWMALYSELFSSLLKSAGGALKSVMINSRVCEYSANENNGTNSVL